MARSVADISVLIIDSQAGMRTQVRNMLALCGITKVGMAVTAGVAIRKLREVDFDVILCEYHLGEGQDGQHLLEDLRHHQLIPLSSIFIMLTGESVYEKVVSAAELAPNDYILKPFSSDKLLERLLRALMKRDALLPTYRLIEAGNTLDAIESCKAAEIETPQYLIDFLRLRAELHLAAGQAEASQEIYQRVLAMKAVPWAKLGLAKTLYMQKKYSEAEGQLKALVTENENYMDAYDWLSKAREAAGNMQEAKEALESAVRVSPHVTRRLRKLGQVSINMGDMETAEKHMSEVVRKGKYSDFRDPEDHVALVKAQLGKGDVDAANNTLRDLDRSMAGLPKTALCKAVSTAMVATETGDTEKALAALEDAMRHNDPRLGASLDIKKDLARICLDHKQDDKAAEVIMDVMRNAANDAEVDTIKSMLTSLGREALGEDLATRIRTEVRDIMADGAKAAQTGDYDGAVRHMMQAVQKLPGNTHVLFNASLALLKHIENMGWNDKFASNARDYIERVRRHDPGNQRLGAMVSYFHSLMKKYAIRNDQF